MFLWRATAYKVYPQFPLNEDCFHPNSVKSQLYVGRHCWTTLHCISWLWSPTKESQNQIWPKPTCTLFFRSNNALQVIMRSPVGLFSRASSLCLRVVLAPSLALIAGWTLSVCLRWLTLFLVLSDALSNVLFELLASILGMHPCKTFPAKESAILILGAGEGKHIVSRTLTEGFIPLGIGRSVTMKFSELGYTVFALCPNRLQNMATPETRPSDVSSASAMRCFTNTRLTISYAVTSRMAPQEERCLK
jgi:hypothetical protein